MLTLLKESKIVKNIMMNDVLDDFDSEILGNIFLEELQAESCSSQIDKFGYIDQNCDIQKTILLLTIIECPEAK
jgi:hypothetical protein